MNTKVVIYRSYKNKTIDMKILKTRFFFVVFSFLSLNFNAQDKDSAPCPDLLWIPDLQLEIGEEFEHKCDGKIGTHAVGLPEGYLTWSFFYYNIIDSLTADSIFFTVKKKKIEGIFKEYKDDMEFVFSFHKGKKDGLGIVKKNGLIINYEFWQNGKYSFTLNENLEMDSSINTFIKCCDFTFN